jgi:LacI family transcriptional regulator
MSRPRKSENVRGPTMADVARHAGVSLTTVSLVLNNRPNTGLRPDTQQRVRESIEHLGYRPNQQARSLVLKRSRTIGFIFLATELVGTPFSGRIISGAHDGAKKAESLLLIIEAEGESEFRDALSDLLSRQVDAIVISSEDVVELEIPVSLRQVPTVLVNCFTSRRSPPALLPDDESGGRTAARMLLDAGHREFAYLAGWPAAWSTKRRLKGFRGELVAAGIPRSQIQVRFGNYRSDSGHEQCLELGRRGPMPSGLFCGNDRMALGAYFALTELGLRVPQDVSVIGYDDQEQFAESMYPPLTTIQLPLYDMGLHATSVISAGDLQWLASRTLFSCPPVERHSVTQRP